MYALIAISEPGCQLLHDSVKRKFPNYDPDKDVFYGLNANERKREREEAKTLRGKVPDNIKDKDDEEAANKKPCDPTHFVNKLEMLLSFHALYSSTSFKNWDHAYANRGNVSCRDDA